MKYDANTGDQIGVITRQGRHYCHKSCATPEDLWIGEFNSPDSPPSDFNSCLECGQFFKVTGTRPAPVSPHFL